MLGVAIGSQFLLRNGGGSVNIPSFRRDFAGVKTLNHGIGPDITFTRTGTATYFDATGTLTTATANVPRFDHDPSTLASKGLLIEEGRTNSLPNSQMSGAVTGSAGTAPTGWSISGNANGLTRTITTGSINGFNYIDVNLVGTVTGGPINLVFDPQATTAGYTASSGQTWTGSCYFALTGGAFPASSSPVIKINERNSSNSSVASTNTSISTATSTLQRFSGTRTLNQATTAKVTLDIRVDSIADGSSVNFTLRIAAPQLEQGAFATSYIPTTTAAATRSADSAIVNPISSFFNTSEGTLLCDFTTGADLISTRGASIDNGSNNQNVLNILGATSGGNGNSFEVRAANSGVASLPSFTTVVANTNYRIVGAYASGNYGASLNGGTAATSTATALPTGLTHLNIGSADGGQGSYLGGHIRKIAYYPKRLSNETLKSLTA